MTKGLDRATHRSLFYSMGWRPEHLDKPLVAVVNSFNELMPGHVHLNGLCQAIKLGIAEAGGTPLEFPTIAICDGLATGHKGMRMPMPSRELIADSIEIMITGPCLRCHGAADQLRQGDAGHAHGCSAPQHPGRSDLGRPNGHGMLPGQRIRYSDLMEAEGLVERGKMPPEELAAFEEVAVWGPGSCAIMGTANTMNILTEALGMTVPGGALTPATSGARMALARRAGRVIMNLHARNILPRDILTLEAFQNALAVDMAVGGSTDTCPHLPAIAAEAGLVSIWRNFPSGCQDPASGPAQACGLPFSLGLL